MKRCSLPVLLTVWLVATVASAAETAGNANIARLSKGEYTYRTIEAQRIRGLESWTLTVHPDGSRSMMSFVDNTDAGVQFDMVQRVDAEFRPLESFVVHWVGGQRKASAHFMVDGNNLRSTVGRPSGRSEEEIEVPKTFSLQAHPVATDGWRGCWYDKSRRGVQAGKNVNLAVAPDAKEPLRGKLEEETVEWLGSERVTVPAGTFDTDHYKYRGTSDMWIMGPDRVVVRYASFDTDREYVLTRLETRP